MTRQIRSGNPEEERLIFKLKEMELWNQFNNLTTEMIITKSGRRMFPNLRINVTRLDPNSEYSILLEFLPTNNFRYKYSAGSGWTSTGEVTEITSAHRLIYIHPDSPARGEEWMSQPISFGSLKLTNVISSSHIVLSSMHKYQPRIVVQKLDKFKNVIRSTFKIFIETAFIAVTAYQNPRVTRLKINNNPFAKGFRKSSRKKRKFSEVKKLENAEDNLEYRQETINTKKNRAFLIDNLVGLKSNETPKILNVCGQRFNHPFDHFNGYAPYIDYDYRSRIHYSHWFLHSTSINKLSAVSVNYWENLKEQTIERFTDFSIKSILNLNN